MTNILHTFNNHLFITSFSSPLVLPPIRLPNHRPPHGVRMDSALHHQKDKILVIMGATGCGKSKLSIDLATRFFRQSEIINSDKMQVYNGLDITTNKITLQERRGVPHHLLGDFDPSSGEFSTSDFRVSAGLAISDIVSRQKLPIIVGGSNSFIHALVADDERFNPDIDVFYGENHPVSSTQLRYNCCFIWVAVSFQVLCDYLCKRVDEMLDSGMFEELSKYLTESDEWTSHTGLRKAIGVPEFDPFFKRPYPPGNDDRVRRAAYEDAVREIKQNTCQLAKRQLGKIMRLRGAGWDLQRVDATEAFREAMASSESEQDTGSNGNTREKEKEENRFWESKVVEPSLMIVKNFLEQE